MLFFKVVNDFIHGDGLQYHNMWYLDFNTICVIHVMYDVSITDMHQASYIWGSRATNRHTDADRPLDSLLIIKSMLARCPESQIRSTSCQIEKWYGISWTFLKQCRKDHSVFNTDRQIL